MQTFSANTRRFAKKALPWTFSYAKERTESAPFWTGKNSGVPINRYTYSSLVCHTYICLPQTERARKMREYLINEGEDALAGALFQMGLCDQWRDLQENYPLKPQWQNKTYEEIFLKNVLTSDLWEILTAPSSLEIIG